MTNEQWSFAIAMAVKPFALLAILGFLLVCRYLVIWYMPEGKLKNILLTRLKKPRNTRPQSNTASYTTTTNILE